MSCGCYGRPRTLTFHLSGTTVLGSATGEVRTGPRMERSFVIRSIAWVPSAATSAGQFIDVLVSADDDTVDTPTPTGGTIFAGPQNLSALPAGDADVGLPVGDQPFAVPHAFRVDQTGRTLKVVSRFQAPAAAPPAGSVVVTVEEFEAAPAPIEPRPPVVPAPAPGPPVPPAPESPAGPGPAPEAPPRYVYPLERVLETWRQAVRTEARNCLPAGYPVRAVTGAGPAPCVQRAVSGGSPVLARATALPEGLRSQTAALSQRYIAGGS